MEGWCERVGSWWKNATPSSSTRLSWVMVPLIVVFGMVILMGSMGSNWVFGSDYHPWMWKWPSSPMISILSDDNIFNHSVSPPVAIQKEDMLIITKNRTGISSFFNETRAQPLSGRIKRKSNRNFKRVEARLWQARLAIKQDTKATQSNDTDYIPNGPAYWNADAFRRSYLEMENQFKVYVYEEGEPPIFHNGPSKGTYATEGHFIYFMEMTKFRTRDPEKAHVYFLPISVKSMVDYIYDDSNFDRRPMRQTIRDYVNVVAGKYPYWNRSLGTDHLILTCHDWGPYISLAVPELYNNSIRALCNANISEGFNPTKDVSIPEIRLAAGTLEGLIGGPPPSQRPTLAFFAGGPHGPIRPLLFEHWENRDEAIQLHRYLPKGSSYHGLMRQSKFCICPSGYEVASPRIVEALYTGCVPVIIKDHYVAPFSDVLNWKAFAVEISMKDIPNLKKILTLVSTTQYLTMQRRGEQMRRHFALNWPPKRYDVFHMFLHSVWLRRLNVRLNGNGNP